MKITEKEIAVLDLPNCNDIQKNSNILPCKTNRTSIDFLGFTIFPSPFIPDHLSNRKTIINTINPHCYIVAKKDLKYRQALKKATILLPDGIGIIWAIKVLNRQKITRFSGSKLHVQLLKRMNETQGKVFYLGSSESTLQKIHQKNQKRIPKYHSSIIFTSFYSKFY